MPSERQSHGDRFSRNNAVTATEENNCEILETDCHTTILDKNVTGKQLIAY